MRGLRVNTKLGDTMLAEDEKWYEVSLRIAGDDLVPERVTEMLGLQPERIGRRGEPITRHPRSARYRKNVWIWRATVDSAIGFEEQFQHALPLVEGRASELRQVTSEAGVESYWFLGFASGNGQGMATLSPGTLGRLAALGLEVVLDLYPDFLNEQGEWQ